MNALVACNCMKPDHWLFERDGSPICLPIADQCMAIAMLTVLAVSEIITRKDSDELMALINKTNAPLLYEGSERTQLANRFESCARIRNLHTRFCVCACAKDPAHGFFLDRFGIPITVPLFSREIVVACFSGFLKDGSLKPEYVTNIWEDINHAPLRTKYHEMDGQPSEWLLKWHGRDNMPRPRTAPAPLPHETSRITLAPWMQPQDDLEN